MSGGAAEVPIIQEGDHHAEQALEQRPLDGGAAAGGVHAPRPGLSLTLPPSGGSSDPPGRRYSMDASSVHSESWELLSHRDGAHSHCGSSPRSLSPSDAYDSEGEGEAAHRRTTAAALLAALPVPGARAASVDDNLVPFGSLVFDGRESPLAAAVAADGSAPASPTAAPPARMGAPMLGPGSVPPSVASSPRSSYEHPSSHASHHDLYSLSQDDHPSDNDSYIDDMMLRGEPELSGELSAGSEPAEPAEVTKPPAPTRAQLALAPAAAVAAAARGALAAASSQLCALAASVSAYLARIVPAGADVAQRVVMGLAEVVGTLRERFAPLGLAPLAHNAAAVRERVAVAVQRARKQMAHKPVNWARVALLLGGACGVMAVMLQRSWAEQARLAALLSKRETDLARLLSRVMELQSRISSAHRGGPLVRHVGMPANTSYYSTPHWPAVIVV
jgi:hypothetical protein